MRTKSLWMDDYQTYHDKAKLTSDIETDTVIVGGGLVGILCAYMLRERGVDCIVVEAKQIGMGITRNTTAKITAQHGIIYSKIENQYGIEVAKQYYNANQQAVEIYRQLVRNIPCDFEEKNAYVYSVKNRINLNKEANIYSRMGIDFDLLEKPRIPIKTIGALGMLNQAQFHPLKFLTALSKKLQIYENTFVTKIQPGKVITKQGNIHARRIILATHYPMVNVLGLYFLKLYQHRSYVLALQGAQDIDGMYIDEEDTGLSFRMHNGYLLLGGGSHKTGKSGGGFNELFSTTSSLYPNAEVQYKWATQDCMTLDHMPYIGRHRNNNRELYVATGFNKWGMTGSMVAARLLSELISEGNSKYARLFSPSRSMLNPQLFSNIGQAAIGLMAIGKRCTHMGCALKWNRQEQTWDCPCHGSRFDQNGNLIDNPAKKGLNIK